MSRRSQMRVHAARFMTYGHSQLPRRTFLSGAFVALGAFATTPVAAQTPGARVFDLLVSRDAGCGCCGAWSDVMARSRRFRVTLRNETDMSALKRRLGVPMDLESCHTATVEGFIIEGHVPAADILRLLEQRPLNIRGLAVPGMPLGAPGMEQAGMARDAFDVIAFDAHGGRQVLGYYLSNG